MFTPGASVNPTEWRSIVHALGTTSLCGHGSGLAEFARSVIAYYGTELASCRA
jgi:formate dehydrogenase iron-sulfur subunit